MRATLAFKVIKRLPQSGSPSVIHGEKVTAADWPVLVIASFAASNETVNCTATVVGPKVVLTSAHCVDAGGKNGEARPAQLDVGGQADFMTCAMPSTYATAPIPQTDSPRSSADYALCILKVDLSSIPDFATTQYESLDTKTSLRPNAPILITGYGCTSVTVSDCKLKAGQTDYKLRAGDARVSQVPTNSGADANYLQSRSSTLVDPALCPGDSGGPLVIGATLKAQTIKRSVIGVNSSIAPICNAPNVLVSRFAALNTQVFLKFLDDWLLHNGQPVVCGYNQNAGVWPCRG
jgi:V8-like Glu-specific endopeptidase